MSQPTRCPSCRQLAEPHLFAAGDGATLTLDLCFACQGIWFDPHENTRLSPQAVLELFELLHARNGDRHQPVAARLQCPRCSAALAKGYDVARGGRYVTYRCAARHGRFSTFGSFMVEKGFVRHLNDFEIEALAQRVGTIACTACGASVDIRRDHVCPWCRSALALLDPEAVDRAMQRYGQQIRQRQEARTPDALADALVALERQNAREERARQRERLEGRQSGGLDQFDLLSAGIDLVWSMLRR